MINLHYEWVSIYEIAALRKSAALWISKHHTNATARKEALQTPCLTSEWVQHLQSAASAWLRPSSVSPKLMLWLQSVQTQPANSGTTYIQLILCVWSASTISWREWGREDLSEKTFTLISFWSRWKISTVATCMCECSYLVGSLRYLLRADGHHIWSVTLGLFIACKLVHHIWSFRTQEHLAV